MIETIPIIAAWGIFTSYLLWYVIAAKHNVPISTQEATALWKIHKINTGCTCHKWQPVPKKGKQIAGFKCQCGYQYIQKKPIIASTTAKIIKQPSFTTRTNF